jgi:hypothetical protein
MVEELIKLPHDRLLVLSTQHCMQRLEAWPPSVVVKGDENKGLDFGLWWRALTELRQNFQYDQLLLVNDSCHVVGSVQEMFARMHKYEFWGITDSYEVAHHLQSYWLMFSSRAIKELFTFMDECQSTDDATKDEIVMRREIALSRHMISKGFQLNAAFPSHIIITTSPNIPQPHVKLNTSYFHWRKLQALGCPLIKKFKNTNESILTAYYVTSTNTTYDVKEIMKKLWDSETMFECNHALFKSEIGGCLYLQYIDSHAQVCKRKFNDGQLVIPYLDGCAS